MKQEQTNGEGKPYHHLAKGFRNPRGSPEFTATAGDLAAFVWRRFRARTAPSVPAGHVLSPAEALAGLTRANGGESITWLGHASFLIRTAGKAILTDPFLADFASPVPPVGPKRFVAPPIAVGNLPPIDVLIVSHNHYDHLDAITVEALPGKDGIVVVVPLGMGSFFRGRGYADVREVDWHQEVRLGELVITALPAIHFSRRYLFDRDRTLWMGAAIAAPSGRVYFAGDTGYGPVFRDIGERHGPFDLALVPIGAYEPRNIMVANHTTPEEAVLLADDIGARRLVAMHWGTIVLTEEAPFEPPRRFLASAAANGFGDGAAWVMRIGETRALYGEGPAAEPTPPDTARFD